MIAVGFQVATLVVAEAGTRRTRHALAIAADLFATTGLSTGATMVSPPDFSKRAQFRGGLTRKGVCMACRAIL